MHKEVVILLERVARIISLKYILKELYSKI